MIYSRSQEVRGAGFTAWQGLLLSPLLEGSLHEVLADLRDVWIWKTMTNSPDDWYVFNV